MTAQPLWQNEEWEIYEDALVHLKNGFILSRTWLEDDRSFMFAQMVGEGIEPKSVYDLFLQLATYWDLKVDFDELRKIRDQAKQEKTG